MKESSALAKTEGNEQDTFSGILFIVSAFAINCTICTCTRYSDTVLEAHTPLFPF